MKKKSKIIIKILLIFVIALISLFSISNRVESATKTIVKNVQYNDYGQFDPNNESTYHWGININIDDDPTKEIRSMPELANWMKKESNRFFLMDFNKLVGKKLNQKRYKDTGAAWDDINRIGHVGGVSANNGMCLCENQGNNVESYELYKAIEIKYELNKGYSVVVNNKTQSLNASDKTNAAKLVQSFCNIRDDGTTGYGTAQAALIKNEAKYYIYYLRDKLGLNSSPITLNSGALNWLKPYATRWKHLCNIL